jgi:hypothetical protein
MNVFYEYRGKGLILQTKGRLGHYAGGNTDTANQPGIYKCPNQPLDRYMTIFLKPVDAKVASKE